MSTTKKKRLQVLPPEGSNISKMDVVTFFRKTLKGVIGFFGVFLIFPIIIAIDCFEDDEWLWNQIEVEK